MSTRRTLDSSQIAEQLHSAAIHLLRSLRRADTTTGLNAPRLSALSVIVFAGPITLGALAAAEQVRPPTMTRIVHALHELGLVTKSPAPDDGRIIYIAATTRGKRILIAGRNQRLQLLSEQIDTLGPRDRRTLQDAAAILRRMLVSGS